MLTRILRTALLAGAAAGLLAALLQLWLVQPVLLQAEMYESGELVHFGGVAHAHADAAEHDRSVAEGDGPALPRGALLILFNMLTYAGYALILVGLMSLAEERGARLDGRTGLVWGVAGFVAVMLAPGVSLAPEVPGVAAADVTARQVWWFATVAMAAVAMGLIAFGKGRATWGAAALLLVAPHVVGAPEPEVFTGPVPPEVAGLFASRVFGVGLAGWSVLGLFAGSLWARDSESERRTQAV
jgi:cobalt transporter subunit CbtA